MTPTPEEALDFVLAQAGYSPSYGGKRLEEAEAILRAALLRIKRLELALDKLIQRWAGGDSA